MLGVGEEGKGWDGMGWTSYKVGSFCFSFGESNTDHGDYCSHES